MGIIARGTKSATGTINFGASTSAKSSEMNTDLNTIVAEINGGLDDDNIASDAAILASKLNLANIAQNVTFNGTVAFGSAANLDVGSVTTDSLSLTTGTVTAIFDEDNMASNSASALATQQSIKAYVDSRFGTPTTGLSLNTVYSSTTAALVFFSGGYTTTQNVVFYSDATADPSTVRLTKQNGNENYFDSLVPVLPGKKFKLTSSASVNNLVYEYWPITA